MFILICNSIVIVLLVLIYVLIDKQLSKKMFYDISVLGTFKLFIAPIFLALFNLFIALLSAYPNWYLSFIPLTIPLTILVSNFFKGKKNATTFKRLETELTPIIISTMSEKQIKVEKKDISLVYYNRKDGQHIDIYIAIKNTNYNEQSILERLESNLKAVYEFYNTRIFLEKKSDFIVA